MTRRHIADRGVTLLRNSENLVPLDAARPLRVLLVSLSADPDAYPSANRSEPKFAGGVDSSSDLFVADTQFVERQHPQASTLAR